SRRLDRRRPAAAEGAKDDDRTAGEDAGASFDVILFQESSQYIDSDALFTKARPLAPRVLVLDEFASEPGTLHTLDGFLRAAASRHTRTRPSTAGTSSR